MQSSAKLFLIIMLNASLALGSSYVEVCEGPFTWQVPANLIRLPGGGGDSLSRYFESKDQSSFLFFDYGQYDVSFGNVTDYADQPVVIDGRKAILASYVKPSESRSLCSFIKFSDLKDSRDNDLFFTAAFCTSIESEKITLLKTLGSIKFKKCQLPTD